MPDDGPDMNDPAVRDALINELLRKLDADPWQDGNPNH